MNDDTNPACPRVEDLSALMDGALTGNDRDEIRAHAARCPLCGALLRDFDAMSTRLHALRDMRCDVDLATLVGPRLPPRAPAARRRPIRHWIDVRQLVPRGLAAAGVLVAGAYLGMTLAGGGAALRPAAMTVFDAAPPGALCAGLPLCQPRGR